MAVIEPWGSSGHIHPKAHGWMKPSFPVKGLLNSVVEGIPTVTAEACHLPQQPEGQPALQVKPVQTGHVGLKRCGTAQWCDVFGAESLQFLAADFFETLGQNGDAMNGSRRLSVLTPQDSLLRFTTAARMTRFGLDRTR